MPFEQDSDLMVEAVMVATAGPVSGVLQVCECNSCASAVEACAPTAQLCCRTVL